MSPESIYSTTGHKGHCPYGNIWITEWSRKGDISVYSVLNGGLLQVTKNVASEESKTGELFTTRSYAIIKAGTAGESLEDVPRIGAVISGVRIASVFHATHSVMPLRHAANEAGTGIRSPRNARCSGSGRNRILRAAGPARPPGSESRRRQHVPTRNCLRIRKRSHLQMGTLSR